MTTETIGRVEPIAMVDVAAVEVPQAGVKRAEFKLADCHENSFVDVELRFIPFF
jgi:hypothetical protein